MRKGMLAMALVGLIIAATSITVSLADENDETPPTEGPQFKLAGAKSAVARYHAAIKSADATYGKAILAAKKDCVADLEPALKSAMKAQNLDEANAIKEFRDQLKDEVAELTPKPTSGNTQINLLKAHFNNTRWQGVSAATTFDFHANGEITCPSWGNNVGHWTTADPNTLLIIDLSGIKYRATVSTDYKYCFWVNLGNGSVFIIRRPDTEAKGS